MVTWLLGILIISLFGIVTTVVLAICKASAYGDYYMALEKCNKCIHFLYSDKKYRLIYCKKEVVIIPELALECKKGKNETTTTDA